MNIAFACVHNSCRSQMAEFLAKKFNKNKNNNFYSFGSDTSRGINKKAVEYIKELYNEDISNYKSKLISDIPKPDILISMGCNVVCPYGYKAYDFDWKIQDPSDFEKKDFIAVIKEIENKVLNLLKYLENK